MADLAATGIQNTQPRRLGTSLNHFGLLWRFPSTLVGFGHLDDGALALHSADSTSGAVHDLGVRLPAGTAQGGTGLSVRWDARHGRALLLAHAPDAALADTRAAGIPLQAWLVSFVAPGTQPGVPR